MTRTLPALAAILFAAAAFVAPAAEACISCEYVPPVVNTPVHSFSGHYAPRRSYTAVRKRRARKIEREVVESKRKARKVETAEKQKPAKKTSVAKAQVEKAPVVKAPVQAKVESENSAISTASISKSDSDAKSDSKPADQEPGNTVGCKKFFPSVGMTLSVPCE